MKLSGAKDPRPPVHFLHVRKTGGTAIKHALKRHSAACRFALVLHPHRTTLRDIPVRELFAFFLRDPVSRFVSGFNSRKRQGQPRFFVPWTRGEAEAFGRFESANDLALGIASDDAARRGAAQRAMRSINHVKSSYWDWFHDEGTFRSRLEQLFFVGFQERLDADFAEFGKRLGLPASARLPTDDVRAHRSPPQMRRELDPAAEAAIRSWYARDYEFIELVRGVSPAGRVDE